MAEAWARHLLPADWEILSAGLLTSPVSRRANAVMQEVGLNLDGQHSKSIDTMDLDSCDVIVTLSQEASTYLPPLRDPGRHWPRPFHDPMEAKGSPDEVREAFRVGREKARRAVREVLDAFSGDTSSGDVSQSGRDNGK